MPTARRCNAREAYGLEGKMISVLASPFSCINLSLLDAEYGSLAGMKRFSAARKFKSNPALATKIIKGEYNNV